MQISNPQDYMQRNFPSGLKLMTCYLNDIFVGTVTNAVEDAISQSSFLDIAVCSRALPCFFVCRSWRSALSMLTEVRFVSCPCLSMSVQTLLPPPLSESDITTVLQHCVRDANKTTTEDKKVLILVDCFSVYFSCAILQSIPFQAIALGDQFAVSQGYIASVVTALMPLVR